MKFRILQVKVCHYHYHHYHYIHITPKTIFFRVYVIKQQQSYFKRYFTGKPKNINPSFNVTFLGKPKPTRSLSYFNHLGKVSKSGDKFNYELPESRDTIDWSSNVWNGWHFLSANLLNKQELKQILWLKVEFYVFRVWV